MRILSHNPQKNTLEEPSILGQARLKGMTIIVAIDPTHQELEHLSKVLAIPLQALREYMDEHERPTVAVAGKHTAVIYKAPIVRKENRETSSFCTFLSAKTCLIISKHQFLQRKPSSPSLQKHRLSI